jgi:hypothetical protein
MEVLKGVGLPGQYSYQEEAFRSFHDINTSYIPEIVKTAGIRERQSARAPVQQWV